MGAALRTMAKGSNRGGKRAGSGRDPGPISVGVLSLPLPTVDFRGVPAAPTYTGKIREAAALFLSGFSFTEIGAQFRVDRHTVASWLRSNPDILESERRPKRDPAQELVPLVPTAVRAYADSLQPETRADVRLRAADSVMDRVYGKPEVHISEHSQRDIRILFVDATPTDTQDPDTR